MSGGGGGPAAPLSGSVRRGAAAPGGAHHRCCAMDSPAITVQVLPRHSSRRRDSAAWKSTPRCRSRETATKIERGCGAAGVPSRVAVRSRAVVALYAAAPAIWALCNGPSRNSRAGPSGHSLRRWDTATGRASLETGRGQRPRRCPVPHGRCNAARGDVRWRRFAILCHAIFILFPPREFAMAVLFCGPGGRNLKQVKGDRAAD